MGESAKDEFEALLEDEGRLQALAQVAFNQIDESGSTFLSQKEWKGLMTLVSLELGFALADTEVEELFREVDANGDGRVTFDEFLPFFRALVKQVADELIR